MRSSLVCIFILLLTTGIVSAEKIDSDYVPGEIIVKFKEKPEISKISIDKEIPKENISSVDRMNSRKAKEIKKVPTKENSRLFKLKVPKEKDIKDIIEEYKNNPDVEYAEPNYIRRFFLEPNDIHANQWNIPNINATLAWNITKGNSSIVIAVIDSGVDWNHSDLASRIWNNFDETEDGIDSDGNGYVDDIRGYDFVDASSGCADGEDCDGNEDNNPMDFYGHGTHVSGIAAADTNNGVGIAGVCWNCTIMPVKAGYKNSEEQGILTDLDVSQALHYAADNGANIISMSFGGVNSSTLQEAIDYAYNKSVVLIAAAGNSNTSSTTNSYPAAYDNVISIAWTTSDDEKATNSNYGAWVDIAAPGSNIYSTYYDDTYATASGTSMSAPHVAGAIGLLLSYDLTLNQTQLRDILVNNGDNISNFGDAGLIMPRLNIYKALLYIDEIPPVITFVAPTPTNNSRTPNTSIFINITSNEILDTAIIEWDNGTKINQTMDGSGLNWYINKTDLLNLTYIYMVFGNDSAGNFGASELWFVSINSTNRLPDVVVTINSTDNLNRTNGTLTGSWVFSDDDGDIIADNETNWFNNFIEVLELANLTIVSHTNTTKNQNWTFSVRVYDGFNWSQWFNETIQIMNTQPILETIADITVNETEIVDITANATDIDNDVVDYTVNDSRFTKTNNQFTWLTDISSSGVYDINITANDSLEIDSQIIVVTVLDAPDFDSDGNPDFNDTDDDNDGIYDESDYLTGNITNINSTIVIKLMINDSENTTQIFNSTLKVNITDESNVSLIEFDWDFTNQILVINWTIDYNSTSGIIRINDLDLTPYGTTKTVYINQSSSNYNYVCIADDETTTTSSLIADSDCSGYTKVSCSSSGQCIDLDNTFKVSSLSHSAVKGIYVAPPSEDNGGGSTGSGGGGGGGGGSKTLTLLNETTPEPEQKEEPEKVVEEAKEKIEEAKEIIPSSTEIKEEEKPKEESGFFAITGRVIGKAYKERPLIMGLLTAVILIAILLVYARVKNLKNKKKK